MNIQIELVTIGHVVYIVTREYCVEATPKAGRYEREYLLADGTWAKEWTFEQMANACHNTREEATAFAMGHGVIPLDCLIEAQLYDEAAKKVDLANRCLDLKLIPTIDRLLREGKREEAVDFVVNLVPESPFEDNKLLSLFQRAKHHNPEAA